MKFKMSFSMDNAAFEGFPGGYAAEILREIAEDVEDGTTSGGVMDINGDTIGNYEITGRRKNE
jgi:hypothetical protein